MQCDICARAYTSRNRSICPSCAQATIYGSRIEQAKALLAREKSHTLVEAVVRPGNEGVLAALPEDADLDEITTGACRHNIDRQEAERLSLDSRISLIADQAETLRQQIEEHKVYLEKQKRANRQRREEISAERKELEKHKPKVLEPVQTVIRKAGQRLDKVHNRTASAKACLCYNVGVMSGLVQERDGQGRFNGRYTLGGIPLLDLRELSEKAARKSMHNADAEAVATEHVESINACFDSVCRLVGIWSHYLAVRLPAEILMPHNDFFHSAILPEKSSYKVVDLPYPGTVPSQGPSPAASARLQEQRNLPRPRLLHLDRPLSKLAKEDQKTFGLFVEGAMLLAWDIAWLCRSQGVTSINTFDDVCNIGRSLWLLHRAQEAAASGRPSLDRRVSTATDVSSRSRKSPTPGTALHFGTMSHGSAQHSLSGSGGAALMNEWRLSVPHRLIDKLRTFLVTEITGAEWDVLSEGDFDIERDDEVAVMVGGSQKKKAVESRHPIMRLMSDGANEEPGRKSRGTSGWTKLRGKSES